MTINFRADADVINGSAGTSVVVARPSGTTDGDVLLAFISATGTPSVTEPAGWTLIGTQDASTNVRVAAYWKVAASEPTSWTWTLGSSQRNGGWVGAYTNVDTTSPIFDSGSVADTTAGTSWSTATVDASPDAPLTVSMVATVRTASGAATTFTDLDDERADQSTNAGSGTDIAFAVADGDFVNPDDSHSNEFTSSQSCTHGALWDVSLAPAFIGYDGGRVGVIVEAAFGADPTGDPDLWDWTDISADLLAGGVTITKGLQPETQAAMAQPTNVSFTLRNFGGDRGDYTPDNPLSQYYPHVVADTPIRVSVPFGYAPPTERAVTFVESWNPDWDASTRRAIVQVQAYGRLQGIQTANAPVLSVLRRSLSGVLPGTSVRAFCYWPGEDDSGATSAASAFAQLPAKASPGVNFGSATDCLGSGPLPTLDAGATLLAPVPAYTATGTWTAVAVVKMPTTPPAATTQLLRVLCTGSAQHWWLELTPGSPDTIHIRAFEDNDSSLLDDSATIVEADVYGQWVMLYIAVTQDGANVDYRGGYLTADAGLGNLGTLNSRTIGRATQVRMAADANSAGMGAGHLGLITDPGHDFAADLAPIGLLAFAALDGKRGDVPYFRFNDLCDEASIPHDSFVAPSIPTLNMGPLAPTTLPAALEECAATDQGLIHDGGSGGSLIMVTRSSRYNSPVRSTQNVDQRELAQPFMPQYTNRNRVTDSIVTRAGGSSARFVDTSIRGGRSESVTLSLDDDHFLEQIAGYRSRLSTTPGMRYPQLQLNLRRKPALVEQWLRCRIGSRVQVVNLWRTHGPGDVDQFIDGYVERLARDRWEVAQHCSPARPFDVPVLESGTDTQFRADCEATTLAAPAGDSDTELLVVSADALVSTDPADYPVDVDIGGEQITVVSEAVSAFVDPFGRTVSGGWGTPDQSVPGTAYVVVGTAGDYSVVGGTTGRIAASTVGTLYMAYADMGSPHGEARARVVVPVLPTGAAITVRTVGRITDQSNLIEAQITINTSGSVTLQLFRRVAGTGSAVPGAVSTTVGTHAAGNAWVIALYDVGDVIKARAWNDTTDTDPGRWQVVGADTTVPLTGTAVGAAIRRETGNTNVGTVNVDWSDLDCRNPQVLTVTRGQYARTHAAGTSVRLWRGRGVAL